MVGCWIHPLYLARWVLSGRELFPRRTEQGTHQLTVEAPLDLDRVDPLPLGGGSILDGDGRTGSKDLSEQGERGWTAR